MKTYVVWNEGRNEGFVSRDPFAAHTAATGKRHRQDRDVGLSAAALEFFETYEGDKMAVEEADLPE